MGVIKRGILGGFSGKVGNVVGSSWKGIAVMKSMPLSVANPRTAGQVAQRTAFATTALFASAILATIVKPMWDRFASQMSGYNSFIQTNIDELSEVVGEKFNDFVMSTGKMAATATISADAGAGSASVSIEWDDDGGEGLKLDDDKAYIVVQKNDGALVEGFSAVVERADVAASVTVKENFVAGDKVAIWLSFLRADGTVVSSSSVTLVTSA